MEDDDRVRMVEDELFSVANRFTAHLHAAEYQRQKREAKTRNAGTIDSISRPVVGRMTPSVRSKQERAAKTRVRRDGVRKAIANARDGGLDADSEDEEESPWMGMSLQGLMETDVHQGPSARLSRLTSVGLNTKASARSSQAGGQASTSRLPARSSQAEGRASTSRLPARSSQAEGQALASRLPARSSQVEGHASTSRLPARATGRGRNVAAAAEEQTDDEDDLDRPPKRSTLPVLPSPRYAAQRVTAHDTGSRAPPISNPPQRQATWPAESAQNTKAPESMNDRNEATIVPLLSDDEDLFASRKRRRQEKENRAPRGALRRGTPRQAPS
ncbi:hypothetical protein IMZ48_47490 [Candidatus Bathyarchaeota archaeon]|nr:hypothetical protein [Candidatus Bathyarchaeota archaeon]